MSINPRYASRHPLAAKLMPMQPPERQRGVSLVELIVFLVVISVGLVALLNVFSQSMQTTNDPAINARALALAQAQLDDILARKFDENTPTGGVPACGSPGAPACLGIVPDTDYDDVGDYNGLSASPNGIDNLSVSVVEAGSELGLANDAARRITVTVVTPNAGSLVLSAYKVNF